MTDLSGDVTTFELQVGAHDSGRLDSWIASQVDDLSRSRVQKLIEQNAVQVNDQPCQNKKYSVTAGDAVVIRIPELEPWTLEPEPMDLVILYEDDQLLIINKPVGMVVHPAPGHYQGTLVHGILAHCGDQLLGVGGVHRPGIVHRLDKDTSGAIVVAKTESALHHLQHQIQTKTARREYLGIVYGAPSSPEGSVDQPIGRHPKDRKRMAVVPEGKGGKRAVTHWSVKERLGNYTLMHYQLETGRTHQIRVHSTFLGHPLIGDPTYGSGKTVGVRLPGQALHAWRLTLQHPVTQEMITAEASLPSQLETLLQWLRQRF